MTSVFKNLEAFDPHTADPHFCWALMRMEEEGYVRISNGKIIPTRNGMEDSPQAILDRSAAPRIECEISKAILEAEAQGMLTIENGVIKLTEEGKQQGIDQKLNEAIANAKNAAGGETDLTPEQLAECGIFITADDEIDADLLDRQRPEELHHYLLWLEGAAHSLVASGHLDAPVVLTPEGITVYDQLVASGWRPQRGVVRSLLRTKGIEVARLDETTDLFMSLLPNEAGE